jgi:Holliday junction resolvase RusA-like endonuclease
MGERPPFDCALELSLLAVFAVPASWSGKRKREALAGIIHKTTRPDLENSVKGALDALQSIVYRDDCQVVCYASCAKIYGERPRLEITIAPIAAPVLPDARAVERQREPADLFAGATP